MMSEWLIYPPLGVIAGILAGLLGVGGGVVIVPILLFVFTTQGFSAHHMMQMALATSLGSIVFTSVASFMTHHRHGAVRWNIVMGITPGILIGSFSGTWFAAQLSTKALKIFFACFLYYVAATMLGNFKPKPSRQLPGLPGMNGVGVRYRSDLKPCRHRRRFTVRSLYDVVQCSGSSCDRHLGGDRLSNSSGWNPRVHCQRAVDCGSPNATPGLSLHTCPLRHRPLQLFHGTLWSQIVSQDTRRHPEAHFCGIPDDHCNPDPLGSAVSRGGRRRVSFRCT